MKKLITSLLLLASLAANAQDTSAVKKDTGSDPGRREFGINATLLIKQILSLSTSNATVLPYDVTYRYISNKWAFRTGLGIVATNSTRETSSTSTSTVVTGPDATAPTISKFFNMNYRFGAEYRIPVKSWLLGYIGIDLAGAHSKSNNQSSQVFNNLPFNYQYTRTTDVTTSTSIGAGPVLGLQFFIGKRLSLFTEVPLYFMHTSTIENTDDYRNTLQSGSSNSYVATTNKQTQTTSGGTLRIILPATVYVAFKF